MLPCDDQFCVALIADAGVESWSLDVGLALSTTTISLGILRKLQSRPMMPRPPRFDWPFAGDWVVEMRS